jgi:hypothetical protein
MVSDSDNCEVYNNILAWNPGGGIIVMEWNRTDGGAPHYVFNTDIHDNVVVMQEKGRTALAWTSYYYSMRMFDPAQNNRGSSNRFGYSGLSESGFTRFAWRQDINSLAAFNTTPGGGRSRYLSMAEQAAVLRSADIPLSP